MPDDFDRDAEKESLDEDLEAALAEFAELADSRQAVGIDTPHET